MKKSYRNLKKETRLLLFIGDYNKTIIIYYDWMHKKSTQTW
jgi:hypothetical protein